MASGSTSAFAKTPAPFCEAEGHTALQDLFDLRQSAVICVPFVFGSAQQAHFHRRFGF